MKEKFYQFLSAVAISFMLILTIGGHWEGLAIFLAISGFSSFFGVFLGIISFVGRIRYKISIPYYLDFVIFAVSATNIANKFFA